MAEIIHPPSVDVSGGEAEDRNGPLTPESEYLLEPGEAVPLLRVPSEMEIAADFDTIAEEFFTHKHDEQTDFDVVGWHAMELMLNGFVDGQIVGDLASGTGVVADKLIKNFNPERILLIDMSEKMLEVAKREIPDDRVVPHRLSVTNMHRLQDSALDLAVCTYGLDYMDVPKALQEISRVVKPDGHFLALVPHPSRNQAYWKAGGNTGTYPDGIWVAEAWPGTGELSVKKQYFSFTTWMRMVERSPFKLLNAEEPVPQPAVARYAPDVYRRYQETGHRIMVMEMKNMKDHDGHISGSGS